MSCFRKDIISSVIRQKGESQNGGNNWKKVRQIFRKKKCVRIKGQHNICVRIKGLKIIVFRNIGRTLFSSYILRFALLPYYRRYKLYSNYSQDFVDSTAILKGHLQINNWQPFTYFINQMHGFYIWVTYRLWKWFWNKKTFSQRDKVWVTLIV